jgi:5-methylcytosine-specific restriction endonuclease McrA
MDCGLIEENMGQFAHLYNTKEWKKLRFRHLHYYPRCVICASAGRATQATVVDHRVRHGGDLKLFYDPTNLDSMCKQCHDSYKQRKELGQDVKPKRSIGMDGFPIGSEWGG